MDKTLIELVNKLQDALATVGTGSTSIDLPQIAVVGSQSSGKSSILTNITGREFLPSGTGIVTRRPLILMLQSTRLPPGAVVPDNETNEYEWGEFSHLPGKKFHNFNDIREEIIKETDKTTGNKGIIATPINLRIFSPNVLTLTLVDLPGLTKVPVGDQPKDIEKQVKQMILEFITKPNAIILAVTAANTDLANSDGLKLAREVDPEGNRTIGVLTKVDLMDQGTDVIDIMEGRVIPLRFGYVPVVNRGQQDIMAKKSIKQALAAERSFFENHSSYKHKANYCGTMYLAKRLNQILHNHIKNTLPDIKMRIDQNLKKYQTELTQLGNGDEQSPSSTVLQTVTEFSNEYKSVLDGQGKDVNSQELSGGARISFVFHEVFANGIRVLDPADRVTDAEIRTLLHNSGGSAPSLFVSSRPFTILLRKQIERFRDPCLRCVQLIYDELIRILNQILAKTTFQRYPELKRSISKVFIEYLRNRLVPTNSLVEDLIKMEIGYINTAHPDLVSGNDAIAQAQLEQNPADYDVKQGKKKKDEAPPKNSVSVSKDDIKDPPFGGFFGDLLSSRSKARLAAIESPPLSLKASGAMTPVEKVDVAVLKQLINSYFAISKRTVSDLVPKSIMYNLIIASKDDIQTELLQALYKDDKMDSLVRENDFTRQRRIQVRKTVKALIDAQAIVSSV